MSCPFTIIPPTVLLVDRLCVDAVLITAALYRMITSIGRHTQKAKSHLIVCLQVVVLVKAILTHTDSQKEIKWY